MVEPYSSGLGGGGFWLLHRASDGKQVMIDGRERAPGKAHRDMYLDSQGKVVAGLSVNGPLAAGIPGEPAALVHIAQQYGRLPLSISLTPAIRAARNGFAVDAYYQRMAGFRLEVLNSSSAAASILLHKGKVPAQGSLIRQPDLAATLEAIAKQGRAGFYQGAMASKLVSAVQQAGGIWTLDDLRNYKVVERKPITGHYRGFKITAAAPPSSGGIVLVTMLNILAGYELERMPDAQRMHVIIEAMRRAYRDRVVYMGDPDFVSMPVERLTHPWYAAGLRTGISLEKATPSTALAVRASVAIPGVLPPVPHNGDLLVDGGVLNNLPFEMMRDNSTVETIIAVDVASDQGPQAHVDFGRSVSGFQALAASLRRSTSIYPSLTSVLLRSMLTGAVRNQKASIADGSIDLLLTLHLPGISLLDFERSREVADAGYGAAKRTIDDWVATRPELGVTA